MSWEARWRDLILAGGAVLVAGCSSDRTHCCNLSTDPCCDLKCGGQVTAECRAEMECEAAGGTFGGVSYPSPGVMATTCNFMQRLNGGDSSTEDAADDADGAPAIETGSFSFCCNANSDPCCSYQYCHASLTRACSEELACQADGGTYSPVYVPQPDGSAALIGCTFAGPDAAPDSAPSDAGETGDAVDAGGG